VSDLVRQVALDWPELQVAIDGDARVLADERALTAVIRNILQNAVVHGAAGTVSVKLERPPSGRVQIAFTDDGRGAPLGAIRELAALSARPATYRGSGVGLLISNRLIQRMHGTLQVRAGARGLGVLLQLPGAD